MIGAIIIILAFFALLVLLSPVKINVKSVRTKEEMDGFFSLGWIMFLLRYKFKDQKVEIQFFGRSLIRLQDKEKSLEIKEFKKSTPIKKSKKMPHLRSIFSLVGPMLRLFKDLIYSFKFKYFDIEFTFGLKDPAYTGVVTGFLHSIIGIMHKGHSIRWSVDFTKPVLEWDINAEVAIQPIQLVLPVARFITDRQVLRSGYRIIRD
jgi:hypothetical protein